MLSKQAGVKVSSLQTKLMADFIFEDFKGAVPLFFTHEKNLKPNLVIFLRFFVALKLLGRSMGCQIDDEQSQEGDRVGPIRN